MEKDYTILHYGISGVSEKWAFSLNQTSFVDRVYYIINEGAGYIVDNKKRYFIKNHIYIINHCANIKYFVEDYNFKHAFIDYINEGVEECNKVVEIPLQNNELIKCDVDSMLCFFENDKRIKYEHACFSYSDRLMLILKSILYDAQEMFEMESIKNSVIADAVKYIRKNYAEDISVKELAKNAHISRNQFSRIFLKNTGFTPYQYIKEYRLNMALAMLEEGMNVGEVAHQCAFLSTSAFSSSFKKRFGKSPIQFGAL